MYAVLAARGFVCILPRPPLKAKAKQMAVEAGIAHPREKLDITDLPEVIISTIPNNLPVAKWPGEVDIGIACYVLDDDRRVITTAGNPEKSKLDPEGKIKKGYLSRLEVPRIEITPACRFDFRRVYCYSSHPLTFRLPVHCALAAFHDCASLSSAYSSCRIFHSRTMSRTQAEHRTTPPIADPSSPHRSHFICAIGYVYSNVAA